MATRGDNHYYQNDHQFTFRNHDFFIIQFSSLIPLPHMVQSILDNLEMVSLLESSGTPKVIQ